MSNVYMRTQHSIDTFLPGGGLPAITNSGVTVDSTQVVAILAAAATAHVSIEQSPAPYVSVGVFPKYLTNNSNLWPWVK